ncbi:MAG: hypothetical protein MI867_00965 [Pseudomonadales bacterium]|nr:hypothetical protein [Pseudomonadales bacterium]
MDVSAETAWDNVQLRKTMFYICDGLLSFKSHNLPERFVDGSEAHCKLWFFNKVPAWTHYWRISSIDADRMILDSEEYGGLVKRWHHIIEIEPLSDNQCVYTDYIDIKAGLATPLIWLWAKVFYRYRQRRWKKLIDLDFYIA